MKLASLFLRALLWSGKQGRLQDLSALSIEFETGCFFGKNNFWRAKEEHPKRAVMAGMYGRSVQNMVYFGNNYLIWLMKTSE